MKTVNICIDIRGFEVPQTLTESKTPPPAGATPSPEARPARKFFLSELSAGVLGDLCEEFTEEVFRKAHKGRPAVAIEVQKLEIPDHIMDLAKNINIRSNSKKSSTIPLSELQALAEFILEQV